MICNVLNMIWTVRDALRHYFPIGYDPQSPHSESIYPSVISLAGQPELIWWALTEGPARRAIQLQPRSNRGLWELSRPTRPQAELYVEIYQGRVSVDVPRVVPITCPGARVCVPRADRDLSDKYDSSPCRRRLVQGVQGR